MGAASRARKVWVIASASGNGKTTHGRRRELPARLAGRPVIRLRSPAEVERFLQAVGSAGSAIAQTKNSPVVPADARQPSRASSRSSHSGS